MRVGFVGLGAMGCAIAARLLGAGYEVLGWNRSPEPCAKLAAEGLQMVSSLGAMAPCDVILSMLADDKAVTSVLLEGGLLATLRPGSVHINMATVSVECARDMAARHADRGVAYIASPVLGRPDAAAEGRLHLLVAGAKEAVDRVHPLLAAIGQRIWPFGQNPEAANVVKIATNLTLACAIEAMGEGTHLVAGYGVPGEAYLEMLAGTLFAAPAYKVYGPMIAHKRFTPPGFRVQLGLKDVKLALQAG